MFGEILFQLSFTAWWTLFVGMNQVESNGGDGEGEMNMIQNGQMTTCMSQTDGDTYDNRHWENEYSPK